MSFHNFIGVLSPPPPPPLLTRKQQGDVEYNTTKFYHVSSLAIRVAIVFQDHYT